MRRRNLLTAMGAGLLSLGGAEVTGPHARAQGLIPISIGCQDAPDWLMCVARDMNLFEKVGLAPTYVKFEGGPPMIAAAESGTLDIASVGSVAFLMGLAQGLDWRMIGINPEGAYSQGLAVRKDSGLLHPIELRGKRIGVYKGSMADYGLSMIFRQHGILPSQVTLEYLTPREQLDALEKSTVDAVAAREPWLQKIVHLAHGRIIAREGDVGIYTNVDTYSVRADWLRAHRPAAVRFLQALLLAYDAVQKDHGIAIRSWAADVDIREEWAEHVYENVPPPLIHQWANPHYTYSLVKNGSFDRRLSFLAGYLFSERIIKEPVDVSSAMDVSVYLDATNGQGRRPSP